MNRPVCKLIAITALTCWGSPSFAQQQPVTASPQVIFMPSDVTFHDFTDHSFRVSHYTSTIMPGELLYSMQGHCGGTLVTKVASVKQRGADLLLETQPLTPKEFAQILAAGQHNPIVQDQAKHIQRDLGKSAECQVELARPLQQFRHPNE